MTKFKTIDVQMTIDQLNIVHEALALQVRTSQDVPVQVMEDLIALCDMSDIKGPHGPIQGVLNSWAA